MRTQEGTPSEPSALQDKLLYDQVSGQVTNVAILETSGGNSVRGMCLPYGHQSPRGPGHCEHQYYQKRITV